MRIFWQHVFCEFFQNKVNGLEDRAKSLQISVYIYVILYMFVYNTFRAQYSRKWVFNQIERSSGNYSHKSNSITIYILQYTIIVYCDTVKGLSP